MVYFADMLRANKLSTSRPFENLDDLEKLLLEMKGRLFSNCISSSPDTPRSLGTFLTGKLPIESGLVSRTRYPGPEIMRGESIFSSLIQAGVPIVVVSESARQSRMLLPKELLEKGTFFYDVGSATEFLDSNESPKDYMLFVIDNGYHDTVNTRMGHHSSHIVGTKKLAIQISRLLKSLSLSTNDHFVLFSDHGCKFAGEEIDPYSLLDRDRSQIVFFHSSFTESQTQEDDRLLSMVDVSNFVSEVFSGFWNGRNTPSYPTEREAVHVEDFSDFSVRFGATVTSWAVYTKLFEYFEPLTHSPQILGVKGKKGDFSERDIHFAQQTLEKNATNYVQLSNDYLTLTSKDFSYKYRCRAIGNAEKKATRLLWSLMIFPSSLKSRLRARIRMSKKEATGDLQFPGSSTTAKP